MNAPGDSQVPSPQSPSSSRHPSNGGAPAAETRDQHNQAPPPVPGSIEDPHFDLIGWHPVYQSCQRFFVNHAQHSGLVQAVAAFVNIRLPFQWRVNAVSSMPQQLIHPISGMSPNFQDPSSSASSSHAQYPAATPFGQRQIISNPPLPFVSLIPYIRRLIVTGFDNEGIMHGFFGNDWAKGVGPLHEIERRNYLFAAKSVGWAKVKYQYDAGSAANVECDETIPFMKPLQRVQIGEIERGEKAWSEWLCMEDWMVGPHAPPPDTEMEDSTGQQFQAAASTSAQATSPTATAFGAATAENPAGHSNISGGDESMQS